MLTTSFHRDSQMSLKITSLEGNIYSPFSFNAAALPLSVRFSGKHELEHHQLLSGTLLGCKCMAREAHSPEELRKGLCGRGGM